MDLSAFKFHQPPLPPPIVFHFLQQILQFSCGFTLQIFASWTVLAVTWELGWHCTPCYTVDTNQRMLRSRRGWRSPSCWLRSTKGCGLRVWRLVSTNSSHSFPPSGCCLGCTTFSVLQIAAYSLGWVLLHCGCHVRRGLLLTPWSFRILRKSSDWECNLTKSWYPNPQAAWPEVESQQASPEIWWEVPVFEKLSSGQPTNSFAAWENGLEDCRDSW